MGRFVSREPCIMSQEFMCFAVGLSGKPLIKLTFKEDQAITGVELYTTNTESFGSNAIVRATTKPATSLPISTVFTASNNPGGPSCFQGGSLNACRTCLLLIASFLFQINWRFYRRNKCQEALQYGRRQERFH